MRSEAEKGDAEISAFRAFVCLSGLSIDPNSVEKREPPEPDLRCRHLDGRVVTFVVVRLVDESIAEVFAAGSAARTDAFRTADPSERMVRRKLTRKYETDFPIELLVYTDRRLITHDGIIVPILERVFASVPDHPFRRAWFMSNGRVRPLWEGARARTTWSAPLSV